MIDEDFEIGLRDDRDAYMVHNPMFRDRIFYSLLRRSDLTEMLAHFLGDSFLLYAFTTSSLPARGSNWSRRIHVDCPRLVPGYATNLNVFIPLTAISELNGGIEILPRSQWQEQPPSQERFQQERVIPPLTAGSALVFYSRLWHSGGYNNSGSPRHALTMNFCRSYMRQRFDYPRMTPESDAMELDDTQRQLLGFNVRVPASLDEYYLTGENRLYKPNQG
jgi:ectoine hydroxylase-related dioxygenase (phytanoyl-CoA dioxygenase family)